MAFIGFNGIIDSQLGQIAKGDSNAIKVAPNGEGTAFQSGVYLFSAFWLKDFFAYSMLSTSASNYTNIHDNIYII